MTLCYEDYLELIGEEVVIMEYKTDTTIGRIIVKESYYIKKQAKFKRAMKNCEIYNLYSGKLTHEVLMDYLGKELKR